MLGADGHSIKALCAKNCMALTDALNQQPQIEVWQDTRSMQTLQFEDTPDTHSCVKLLSHSREVFFSPGPHWIALIVHSSPHQDVTI